MKAAVLEGIEKIKIIDVPVPEIKADEALLKVEFCGICGTDIKIYKSGYRDSIDENSRRILGHEVVGTLVDVGEDISFLSKGMRVGIAPSFGCGICYQCISGNPNLCIHPNAFGVTHDGGFAEYMLITSKAISSGNVIPLSDRVSPDVACLAEPLSCCINGHEALGIELADQVLVIGAGPIGIMHLLLSKLNGASRVIVSEINEARIEKLSIFKPDFVINPSRENITERIREITDGHMADKVIVAVSSAQAQNQAIEFAGIKAKILLFAGLAKEQPMVSMDSNQIHYKQLSIFGTTGSNVRQYIRAMNLIESGAIEIEKLISDRIPLSDFAQGLKKAQEGTGMKVLIHPT